MESGPSLRDVPAATHTHFLTGPSCPGGLLHTDGNCSELDGLCFPAVTQSILPIREGSMVLELTQQEVTDTPPRFHQTAQNPHFCLL